MPRKRKIVESREEVPGGDDVQVKTECDSQEQQEANEAGTPENPEKPCGRSLRPRKNKCYAEKDSPDFEEKRTPKAVRRRRLAQALNKDGDGNKESLLKEGDKIDLPDLPFPIPDVRVEMDKLPILVNASTSVTASPKSTVGDSEEKGKQVEAGETENKAEKKRPKKVGGPSKKIKKEPVSPGAESALIPKTEPLSPSAAGQKENTAPKPKPKRVRNKKKPAPVAEAETREKDVEQPVEIVKVRKNSYGDIVGDSKPQTGPKKSVKKRNRNNDKASKMCKTELNADSESKKDGEDEKTEEKGKDEGSESKVAGAKKRIRIRSKPSTVSCTKPEPEDDQNQNKSAEKEEENANKEEASVIPSRKPFSRGRKSKLVSARIGKKEVVYKDEGIDPEDIKGFEHVERYVTPAGVRLPKFWDSEDELSDDESNDNFRRIMCGFGTNCRIHEVIRPASEIVRRLKELQNTFGASRTLPLFQKYPDEKIEEDQDEHDANDSPKASVPGQKDKHILWHNDPMFFQFATNYP